MKICNYFNFILESKLELLSEANIYFAKKFKDYLSSIDSPLSKKILNLYGKDIDINFNLIDVDLDKEDSVLFLPNDKIETKLSIIDNREFEYIYSKIEYKKFKRFENIKNFKIPNINTIGDVVFTFTMDDFYFLFSDSSNKAINDHFLPKIKSNGDFIVFRFKEGEYVCDFITQTGFLGKTGIGKAKPSSIKIGRFVKKLLDKSSISVTDKEIEEFVNKYKSLVRINNDAFLRFKEVNGEDIRKYYNVSYYDKNVGTLGNSCMRYDKCRKYFDIYVKNPDKVSLIILKSIKSIIDEANSCISVDTRKMYISGRALLWNLDDGRKFMDRIYVSDSSEEELFKEYAKKMGYIYI
jgi:hypothetical protein